MCTWHITRHSARYTMSGDLSTWLSNFYSVVKVLINATNKFTPSVNSNALIYPLEKIWHSLFQNIYVSQSFFFFKMIQSLKKSRVRSICLMIKKQLMFKKQRIEYIRMFSLKINYFFGKKFKFAEIAEV